MTFLLFFQENMIWLFMQIVLLETICMKCQNLFLGKNKKKYLKMWPAEFFTQSARC